MMQFLSKACYSFVFFALIGSQAGAAPSYEFNPGAKWEAKAFGGTTGWVAKDTKATIVVFTNQLNSGVFSVQGADVPKIVKLMEDMKNFQGQATNTKNWKVRKHELHPAGGKGALLKLEGDYIGMTGGKVNFVEWHYYIGNSHYRIVYSQNAGNGTWSKKNAETILSQFRPEGVSS